jgi:hypothetical protein
MATATTLPLDLPDVDDIELVDPDDCCVCGTTHEDALHGAVMCVRGWLRSDLHRRLTEAPAAKPFKLRSGKAKRQAVLLCGRS